MNSQRKIPTLLAIVLIVGVLTGITVFTNVSLSKNTLATSEITPDQAVVTNVSDTGFTVTTVTEKPVSVALTITDPMGVKQTFFDERYTSGEKNTFTVHSISARGLTPQTSYQAVFLVNGKNFPAKGIETIFTGTKVQSDSNGMPPIYGTVSTVDSQPAGGALVYLTIGENSQLLSALVKPSGSFLLPLNLLRTKDLLTLFPKTEDRQQVNISIKYDRQVTTIVTDTLNASPVPPVVIGQTYDFRNQQANRRKQKSEEIANGFSSLSPNVLGSETTVASIGTISLVNPPENAHIPADLPHFSGRGIPGNLVTLLLGKTTPRSETTKVLPDGTWQHTPSKSLSIGSQQVTMTTLDASKKPVAITHTFEILKSGTQVLGDATPSASPTFAVPTTTIIPTTIPTVQPTVSVEPTETITPTPTVPTTGITLPTNLLLIAGVGLLFSGLLLIAL